MEKSMNLCYEILLFAWFSDIIECISMHGGWIGMKILLAWEQKSKILFPRGFAAWEKNFTFLLPRE